MKVIFNSEQEEALKRLKVIKECLIYSTTKDSYKPIIDYMIEQIEYVAATIGGAEGLEELKGED